MKLLENFLSDAVALFIKPVDYSLLIHYMRLKPYPLAFDYSQRENIKVTVIRQITEETYEDHS